MFIHRFYLVWLSLFVNLLLLVLLIQAWWHINSSSVKEPDRSSLLARDVAAEFGEFAPQLKMGVDVYSAKDPFAILVDKNFPSIDRFTFLVRGRPFFVTAEDDVDGDEANAMKGVDIAFGDDFSFGCDYTNTRENQTRQITLFNHDQYLTDLNADGRWDQRIVLPKQPSQTSPPLQIWYKDKWEELPTAASSPKDADWTPSRYEVQLQDGTVVIFDMKRGKWLSEMDESAVNRDQET